LGDFTQGAAARIHAESSYQTPASVSSSWSWLRLTGSVTPHPIHGTGLRSPSIQNEQLMLEDERLGNRTGINEQLPLLIETAAR
jgi:hypothetical protein